MSRQQEPGDHLTMANAYNGISLLAHSLSLTCTVFLRTDFGREGIGVLGLCSIVLMLFYATFTQCPAMLVYFWLWILAVICQRIKQAMNRRRGVILHSYYNGYPWLVKRVMPRISERNAKGVEAFLCMFIGFGLAQLDPPLGWFVIAGGVATLLAETLIVEQSRRRLQMMRDAEIEQRYLAEQYKSGRF